MRFSMMMCCPDWAKVAVRKRETSRSDRSKTGKARGKDTGNMGTPLTKTEDQTQVE